MCCRSKLLPTLLVFAALLLGVAAPRAQAEPIAQLADFAGVRDNVLVGYGLVVGLDGTHLEGEINKGLKEVIGVYTSIFNERPDLNAALHTHAPYLTAHAIAHNLEFDEKVLGAEYLRAGLPDPLARMDRLCTMRASTDHCKLPGRRGYKWPTLEELHRHLFDEPIEGSHDAARVAHQRAALKKPGRLNLADRVFTRRQVQKLVAAVRAGEGGGHHDVVLIQ